MNRYALLFPGQGSQYIGMAKNFYELYPDLFDEAETILNLPLKKLMFEGQSDELTSTAIAQPAILLHSIVAYKAACEHLNLTISCALGHSLGEYSALVTSSVLSFADALKIVHTRGKLMQDAVPKGMGSMAAVLGIDALSIKEALEEFADEKSNTYVACANFNGPLQTVIAGTCLGIEKASIKLKSLGAKRIVLLPVSAPFHCALMKPAQEKMEEVLSSVIFNDARFPVISNVTATKETLGKNFSNLLLSQITSPVKFTDCVRYVKAQHLCPDGFLELGPKVTLSAIVKKIDSDIKTFNIDTPNDLAMFKE